MSPRQFGRPFAANVIAFSDLLENAGFRHGAAIRRRQPGRFQIEVHPHAATVSLFELERILKYKRGARDARAQELRRLRRLILSRLSRTEPSLVSRLPHVPRVGNTKPVEDQIDAVLCAFIAAHWEYWANERNSYTALRIRATSSFLSGKHPDDFVNPRVDPPAGRLTAGARNTNAK